MHVDKFFFPYMTHRSYVIKQKPVKTQAFLPGKTEVLIFVTYRILHELSFHIKKHMHKMKQLQEKLYSEPLASFRFCAEKY